MKTAIFLSVISLFTFRSSGQNFQWTKQFATSYNTYGEYVLSDLSGNAYVVSKYRSQPSHGPGVLGWTLNKYDKDGSFEWSDTTESEVVWIPQFDAHGKLVLFGSDSFGEFVQEIDKTTGARGGKNYLVKSYSGFRIQSAEFDPDNNLVLCGLYQYSVDIEGTTYTANGMGNTVFIAKYDPQFSVKWVKVSLGDPYFSWMTLDNKGNVYLTGEFSSSLTFGGQGITKIGKQNYNGYLAKIDANGNQEWIKTTAGDDKTNAPDVYGTLDCDADGNVLISCALFEPYTLNSKTYAPKSFYDILIIKTDHAGQTVWAKQITGWPGSSNGVATLKCRGNDIYIGGAFAGNVEFSSDKILNYNFDRVDGFLARFDQNGNFLTAIATGAGSDAGAVVNSLDVNAGYVYVTGQFTGKVSFGEVTPLNGYYEMFVSRIVESNLPSALDTYLQEEHLSLFPNPSSNTIKIGGISSQENWIAEILDNNGRQVYIVENKDEINLRTLPPGVYHVRVVSNSQVYHSKVVKQ